MVRLFNMTLRIRHLVSDDSELGAYSETARSRVYRYTAQQMPKMLFLATYCTEDIVQRLYSFVSQWEQCELGIKDEAVGTIGVLDSKHRGPFLFWLLNERSQCRTPPRRTCMRGVDHAPAGVYTCLPAEAVLHVRCSVLLDAAVEHLATAFPGRFGLA